MPRRYNLTETPYQSPDQLARACSDVLEAVLRKSYDEDNPIEPVHVKRSEEKQGDARHSAINKTLRDLERETFKKFNSSNSSKKYKAKQNRNNNNGNSKFAKNNSNIITKLSNSSSMVVNCSKTTLKSYHRHFGVFGDHHGGNKKQHHFYISMWYEINTQFKRIPDINDFPIIIYNSNKDSLKLSFVGIQTSKIDKPVSHECQLDTNKLENCKTIVNEDHQDELKCIEHVLEDEENHSNTEYELKIISQTDVDRSTHDIEDIRNSLSDTSSESNEIIQLFSLSNNEPDDEVYYDITEDENQDNTVYHDALADPVSGDNEDDSTNAQRQHPLDDYEEVINYLREQIHHVPPPIHPNASRRNHLEHFPFRLQAIVNYLNGQGDNQQIEDFEQFLFRQNGQAMPESITVRVEFSSYTKLIAFLLAINTVCLLKLVIGDNPFSSFF